jgi:hypothetical protein
MLALGNVIIYDKTDSSECGNNSDRAAAAYKPTGRRIKVIGTVWDHERHYSIIWHSGNVVNGVTKDKMVLTSPCASTIKPVRTLVKLLEGAVKFVLEILTGWHRLLECP